MSDLATRDLRHIWHPCSQMKDYENFPPLEIIGAEGSYLQLQSGQKIIDAISSWWCKGLGHNHPRLKAALIRQAEKFEHVILANTTNDTIVALSEKLTGLTNNLNKIFYCSDGSSAVEVALKLCLHTRSLKGQKRTKFASLSNAYHGETLATLSVSDVGLYRTHYESHLFDTTFINSIPYVASETDPVWHSCQAHWETIETQLNPVASQLTAIIVEPIVQGAAGMQIYSQDFLKRLRAWTQQHDIYLIADEIMTGFGRTGKMLACEHAGVEPDLLCLGKGLTSGWLPLSAVLVSDEIYECFYADYDSGKAFLHSHTHSGNTLAAAIASEVCNIYAEQNISLKAVKLGENMREAMYAIAKRTGKLTNVRGIGGIVAADLLCESKQRMGFMVYKKAITLGALLRPIGNTIYWVPPLNMEDDTLKELQAITEAAISSTSM